MQCLVCGSKLDMEKHLLVKRLGSLGYAHEDKILRCETCGWEPVFGVELEETKPPYWFPPQLPKLMKKRILKTANREWPYIWRCCSLCEGEIRIHKVFWGKKHYDKKERPQSIAEKARYIGIEDGVYYAWMAGHIVIQLKCNKCYYVRYFTI